MKHTLRLLIAGLILIAIAVGYDNYTEFNEHTPRRVFVENKVKTQTHGGSFLILRDMETKIQFNHPVNDLTYQVTPVDTLMVMNLSKHDLGLISSFYLSISFTLYGLLMVYGTFLLISSLVLFISPAIDSFKNSKDE
jgi:hypothetical protein